MLNSQFKETNTEFLFLALPHKISQYYVKKFYKKIKIIDLSADFRLDNEKVYNKNYDHKHSCPELLNKFVYGLFEVNFNLIKNTNNIAVPGCYPTSVLLPLIPLLKFNIINSLPASCFHYKIKIRIFVLFCEIRVGLCFISK